MVSRTLEAAIALKKQGINARVIEMHTIKPLDNEQVLKAAEETGALVTIEEHSIIGGLGGAISECVALYKPTPLEMVGVNDTFAESGPYPELLDKYGLGVPNIMNAAKKAISRK
jgi:transketolase